MRELAVARREAQDEQGRVHSYDYSILVGEMTVSPGVACESYGVKVLERDGECEEIRDVTVNISRIDELMDLLVSNVVTPCTLRDVVEDWL